MRLTDTGGARDVAGWQWDVALSFASEQRGYVEQVAKALKARGVRCFYDADEQIELWGKYLAEELPAIYSERAAAAVVFVSAEYAARDWTRLERRAALNRAVRERQEYVLPARFDDTPLPGLLLDMVAVELRGQTPEQFAGKVAEKLAALGITGPAPRSPAVLHSGDGTSGPLKAWARKYRQAEIGDRSPPTEQQLLDSVYFDLTDMRKAIRRAKAAAPSRVLGFGVTYSEFVFVNKLCDWLANYLLGETQRKDPLNLKPELAPVSRRLRQVARYREDLESANVLCLVLVDAVPRECIAEFWDGICHDFAGIGRYLALVFTGDGSTAFPPEVAVLPPPRFDLEDVALWAEEMISRRGWPPDMADAWTDLLRDEALDNGELDVPALYEAMDRSIQAIRFEPDEFRVKLEMRIRHANPA
jgi:hypothetical protein